MEEKDCREATTDRTNSNEGSCFQCPKCQMEWCISIALVPMYAAAMKRNGESRSRIGQKRPVHESGQVILDFQMDRQGGRMQNAMRAHRFGGDVRKGLKINWVGAGGAKGKRKFLLD